MNFDSEINNNNITTIPSTTLKIIDCFHLKIIELLHMMVPLKSHIHRYRNHHLAIIS